MAVVKSVSLGLLRMALSRDGIQTLFGFSSLAAIGIGCWWERPSVALIVVGGLLLSGIVYARTKEPGQ